MLLFLSKLTFLPWWNLPYDLNPPRMVLCHVWWCTPIVLATQVADVFGWPGNTGNSCLGREGKREGGKERRKTKGEKTVLWPELGWSRDPALSKWRCAFNPCVLIETRRGDLGIFMFSSHPCQVRVVVKGLNCRTPAPQPEPPPCLFPTLPCFSSLLSFRTQFTPPDAGPGSLSDSLYLFFPWLGHIPLYFKVYTSIFKVSTSHPKSSVRSGTVLHLCASWKWACVLCFSLYSQGLA